MKSHKKSLLHLKRFNSYRKYLNRIAGVLGTLLIFYMICSALNYMYVTDEDWCRILWHNFYEDDGKIDNIYLGSSHVYCDINPMQLDDINGQYNFNLASPIQRLNGSYYLLKEADKNNALSHVYLELFYACNVKNNFNSDEDMIDTGYSVNWQNTDYMKTSYNKFEYMISIAGAEKYADIFLPFSRYRRKLDDWDYIGQRMEAKRTDAYLEYDKYNEYIKQGYSYLTGEFLDEQRLFYQSRILEKNPIGEKSEKYLQMIISYCQKRDIPITLFVSPIEELQLISTEHYDNYINQLSEIAEEYGVEFYDFNLTKEEYLDIQHGEYFGDIHGHLNYRGADMFTSFFSEVVSGTASENEKYFYASYEEKLRSIAPAIYGLYYRDSEDLRTYHIASNREEGMEYRITLTPTPDEAGEGTEQSVVQDYSENKEFTLSKDEHGKCTIEARMTGKEEAEAVQVLTIDY